VRGLFNLVVTGLVVIVVMVSLLRMVLGASKLKVLAAIIEK
jgi:hypothetical protein